MSSQHHHRHRAGMEKHNLNTLLPVFLSWSDLNFPQVFAEPWYLQLQNWDFNTPIAINLETLWEILVCENIISSKKLAFYYK